MIGYGQWNCHYREDAISDLKLAVERRDDGACLLW